MILRFHDMPVRHNPRCLPLVAGGGSRLETRRVHPRVQAAHLSDRQGRVFAPYARDGHPEDHGVPSLGGEGAGQVYEAEGGMNAEAAPETADVWPASSNLVCIS